MTSNPLNEVLGVGIMSGNVVNVHVKDLEAAKRVRDYISDLVTSPVETTESMREREYRIEHARVERLTGELLDAQKRLHSQTEIGDGACAWGLEASDDGGVSWRIYYEIYPTREKAAQAAANGRPAGAFRVVAYRRAEKATAPLGFGVPNLMEDVRRLIAEHDLVMEDAIQRVAIRYELRSEAIYALRDAVNGKGEL